jgi:pyruvate/2-oxoglutarate dehydrogenase complex dihydrolipoamide acyltransferase (E2) component
VSSSSTETLVDVTMPQMGVSVAEGTVVEWKKQPGDWVQADEIIASISTDKIDTDVEAPATGRVQELIVEVGATVEVGTVLARIATDAKPGEAHRSENAESASADSVAESAGADSASSQGTSEAAAAVNAPGEAGELQGDTAESHAGSAQRGSAPARRSGSRRYSPVVMRIASEHGVDLDQVEGTGRGGRVRKQDVLAFIENGAAAAEEPPMHIESPYRPDEPAPAKTRTPRFEAPAAEPAPAPAGGAPLSRMRQAIGARMLQSLQTAATCTTVVEADLIRIEAARKHTGFTYLPYIARATVEALREFPQLNATLEDDTLTTYDGVHLGIAVSLGEGGLIVPVIRDAQELSVEGLAKRIKDLAVRARENRLQPDEVRGGSFTITNPGGYGSIIATPVINQPQVAILDTEAVVKRPVVITDELGNDSIAIRPMTYLCMSWDHRALDGALAAQFLSALRKKLESWPTT